jgi:Uma2 family endonuclease
MTTALRRAKYEDLFDLPEHVVGEIVDGHLEVSPRPAIRHARATSALGYALSGPFWFGASGGPGGWFILDEPEVHLDEDVVVPDLAGWRRERLPELPDEAAFVLAPDWVCEVLSPRNTAFDRAAKMPVYARHSVAHLWLVDPQARLLEVFRLEHGRWSLLVTHRDNARIRAEPFDAVEIDLGLLWSA